MHWLWTLPSWQICANPVEPSRPPDQRYPNPRTSSNPAIKPTHQQPYLDLLFAEDEKVGIQLGQADLDNFTTLFEKPYLQMASLFVVMLRLGFLNMNGVWILTPPLATQAKDRSLVGFAFSLFGLSISLLKVSPYLSRRGLIFFGE